MSCPLFLMKGEKPLFSPHITQPVLYLTNRFRRIARASLWNFSATCEGSYTSFLHFQKSFAYCRKIFTVPAFISRHYKRGYQRKIRIHIKRQTRTLDRFSCCEGNRFCVLLSPAAILFALQERNAHARRQFLTDQSDKSLLCSTKHVCSNNQAKLLVTTSVPSTSSSSSSNRHSGANVISFNYNDVSLTAEIYWLALVCTLQII